MEFYDVTTDLWSYLEKENRPLVIYGTGDGADKIIDELGRRGLSRLITGIFASPGFVREGRVFRGFPVEPFEDIYARLSGFIVLAAFGSALPDVLSYVYSLEEKCELYAPDVPVCGGEVFDMEFVKRNEDRLANVYSRLADDLSQKTFRDLVNYKLSGSLKYLRSCEVTPDEADGILGPFKESSFIDLGAYRGDTLIRFTQMFPAFISATALEPERHSFSKLKACAGELNIPVTCVNALVSDTCGKALITSSRGRGTRAASGSGSGREIDKVTVDSLADAKRAGFIKIDVEGSEFAAIEGARNTITDQRPQIKIACYHKSADLFEIPETVFEIRDDYRLFMRHTPCIPGWDVDYYFL